MPKYDLFWAYVILALMLVALALMVVFLDLAWQRLRPFLPRN